MSEPAIDTSEFDNFVAEAKRLRTRADIAEQEFMEFLLKNEGRESMWRGCGFVSFDNVLDTTQICRPSRYRRWKLSRDIVGEGVVSRIGIDGAWRAAEIPDVARREACIKHMVDFVDRNKVPVSAQTAQAIQRKYFIPQKQSREERRDQTVALLRKEVSELKRENRKLSKENRRLAKLLEARG